jgi:predicted RNA polymerase sigma factor
LAKTRGNYLLQACIAACHARAPRAADTDWHRIAELYSDLVDLTHSPIVELNRAVAVSMAHGASEGLELVEALVGAAVLDGYPHLWAVRGDLLEKLGRRAEASAEFSRAASLATNDRERAVLQQRADHCSS